MPGPISRIGDILVTGHPCHGFTSLSMPKQATVFASGKAIARIGDLTIAHLILVGIKCVPHIVPIITGIPTVHDVGIPTGTVGSKVDLGQMITGDISVLAGGGGGAADAQPLGPGF